jgi:hypothetical protein
MFLCAMQVCCLAAPQLMHHAALLPQLCWLS